MHIAVMLCQWYKRIIDVKLAVARREAAQAAAAWDKH